MPADTPKFFRDNPDVEFVDLLIPDANGILRGKKIAASQVDKAFSQGIFLPRSLFGSDVRGNTVDATDLGITTGDRDYVCRPEAATLRALPWDAGAQCFMEMYDDHDEPFAGSPRGLLRTMVQASRAAGLFPTVAVELEFYLFQSSLDAAGSPRRLIDPVTGDEAQHTQVYGMDDLELQRPFIESVRRFCAEQSVPASTAVAEYAPGQFEINLQHTDDPVQACDDAMCLKRIVRAAARDNDMLATFMAKPMADLTGSGMHLHMSICDAQGRNRFVTGSLLKHAVGGLQATMADAMLLFAPHANSYRRYRKGFYVPQAPTWGYNNRSVALRIPAGDDDSRRIEHRVAGADANPYLVTAAMLAGILHGVNQAIEPDAPVEGNAEDQVQPSLPADWLQAIRRFGASAWVGEHFGDTFRDMFVAIKDAEYQDHRSVVPPLDFDWYLQTV